MIYLALALGLASLTGFLILRDKNGSVPALFLKTLASVFFMAVACIAASGAVDAVPVAMLVIMGLLLGLVGDILLDLMFMYPGDRSAYLAAGMGSFAAGHVLYIIAISLLYGPGINILYALLIALAVNSLLFVTGKKTMNLKFGSFAVPSFLYGTLLTWFLVSILFSGYAKGFDTAASLLTAGAFLFLASDMVLSMTYFGGRDGKGIIVINHLFYYAAQYLIASSVLFM